MNTSELAGAALDWAVAKADGQRVKRVCNHLCKVSRYDVTYGVYSPSTDWSQGGLIIEQEFIATFNVETCPFEGQWAAGKYHQQQPDTDEMGDKMYSLYPADLQYGPTPLIAAMRCYVASKFGDEVEIPEELL